MTTVTMQV